MPNSIVNGVSDGAASVASLPVFLQWAGAGVFLAAIVAGIVALIGHIITRANAKLQGDIADRSATLTNKISSDNAKLQADVSRENSALASGIAQENARMQADVSRQSSELSNRISRENAMLSARLTANVKLAEMRQAWINSLRSDMSEFQAFAVTPGLDFQQTKEFYKLMARVELAMNPADEDYNELSRTLYEYINTDEREKRRANDIPFIAVCQKILKREWDVLKEEIRSITE